MTRAVIVGAGPAGISAAAVLASPWYSPSSPGRGTPSRRPGLSAARRQPPAFPRRASRRGKPPNTAASIRPSRRSGLTSIIDPNSLVWSIFDREVHALDRGRSEAHPFDALILAPGAIDRVLPIPGWTLPGSRHLGRGADPAQGPGLPVGPPRGLLRQLAFALSGRPAIPAHGRRGRGRSRHHALFAQAPRLAGSSRQPRHAAARASLSRRLAPARRARPPWRAAAALRGNDGGPGGRLPRPARRSAHRLRHHRPGLRFAAGNAASRARRLPPGLRSAFPPMVSRSAIPTGGAAMESIWPATARPSAAPMRPRSAGSWPPMRCSKISALRRRLPRAGRLRRRLARLRRFQRGLARAFAWPHDWLRDLPDDGLVCRCEEISAGALRQALARIPSVRPRSIA